MIDSQLQEIKQHGDYSFPYMVYRGNIPAYLHYYPLHWHEEMEFIYVISGTGLITVNTYTYEIHCGDILILRPHDIHSIEQKEHESFEYFNLLFRFSLLEDKISTLCLDRYFTPLSNHSMKVPVHVNLEHPLNPILSPLIQDLINHRKESTNGYELMVKSNLYSILYHLQPYLEPDFINSNQNRTYDKLKDVLTYIKEHYHEPITIDTAASICCYSKSYFMKFFKAQTGKSLIQYVNEYRMEIAARLLQQSPRPIIEIAMDVGFENLAYFTRVFERTFGITPGKYRKKMKSPS